MEASSPSPDVATWIKEQIEAANKSGEFSGLNAAEAAAERDRIRECCEAHVSQIAELLKQHRRLVPFLHYDEDDSGETFLFLVAKPKSGAGRHHRAYIDATNTEGQSKADAQLAFASEFVVYPPRDRAVDLLGESCSGLCNRICATAMKMMGNQATRLGK